MWERPPFQFRPVEFKRSNLTWNSRRIPVDSQMAAKGLAKVVDQSGGKSTDPTNPLPVTTACIRASTSGSVPEALIFSFFMSGTLLA